MITTIYRFICQRYDICKYKRMVLNCFPEMKVGVSGVVMIT